MIRRLFFPADVAPQIRIDRALDDEVAALFEERLQLGRQQRDHPIGDELVGLESPRRTTDDGSRQTKRGQQHAAATTHARSILLKLDRTTSRTVPTFA